MRFAAGFYAGWSGAKGKALAQPSANDVAAAEAYVAWLLLEPTLECAEGWGRDFGAYARHAASWSRGPFCSMVHALRVHGDAFAERLQERHKKAQQLERVAAQREHHEQCRPAYLDYLRAQEERLKAEQPEIYARFAEHEAKQRAFPEKSKLTARSLAVFEAEEQRLTRLQLFFAGDAESGVLDFWGWDAAQQPAGSVSPVSSVANDSNARYDGG